MTDHPPIYTVGHSTRSLEEFVSLLKSHAVEKIVDVRTIPRSRRNPQFAGEALATTLPRNDIAYTWMKALGGLRRPRTDSQNMAWRNDSFRGYADHMQTPEFERAIAELLEQSSAARVAIMCAEAVPWRCHRSLIGDALLVRDVEVFDIMSETSAPPHKLTSFARADGTNVAYPATDSPQTLDFGGEG